MTGRVNGDRLVWIDCEMTGLDLARDALIEVSVVVTDAELRVLDPGLDLVIHTTDDLLDSMLPVVQEMHAASGLTEEVRRSTLTLADAERQVMDYVTALVPEPRSAPLCGNSIATDRGFIARDMPTLDAYLHYRMVDVSSVKELTRRWYPRVYFAQPAKGLAHRALSDILESIRELEYYRRAVFVPPPGPSSADAQAVAAELLKGTAAERPGGTVAEQPGGTVAEQPGRTAAERPAGAGEPAAASGETDVRDNSADRLD